MGQASHPRTHSALPYQSGGQILEGGWEEEELPSACAVKEAEAFMWRSAWKQVRREGSGLRPVAALSVQSPCALISDLGGWSACVGSPRVGGERG